MNRLLAVLVLAIAGAVAAFTLLPPRPEVLDPPSTLAEPVRGVVHVHSRRSDGSGTADDIAAAARRAGLRFVIFTDHGDGTRQPDAPVYRNGVLCVDAVEVSTDGGHLVALGLPRAPYPLGGEARDVVEDVKRLGGFAIAAHPGSPKPGLRWTEWSAPFDGIEWLNGDSEWRDESALSIAHVLFTYPLRGASSLALLLDRPDAVLRRWDVLTRRRPVVALAGTDAHARFGTRGIGEGSQGGIAVHIPSYEQVFRTFSVALPDARLSGRAQSDAEVVLAEIRRGHVYSSVDAIAAPARMTFSASTATGRAVQGDTVAPGRPVMLRVETDAPPGARIDLYANGSVLESGAGPTLDYAVSGTEATVYRAEVRVPGAPGRPPVPWLVSNPIYVRADPTEAPLPQRPPPATIVTMYDNGSASGWTVEHSGQSAAAFDVVRAVGGSQIAFRYGLGGTIAHGPYAALVMPAGAAVRESDRLMFTARADRPMRVSVQLRTTAGERWRRSIYLDTTPRPVSVFFDDMTPIGATVTRRPPLDNVVSVLWVVDTVNATPDARGQLWIDDVKYGGPPRS